MARDGGDDTVKSKRSIATSVDKIFSRSVIAGTLIGTHLGDISKLFFKSMFGELIGNVAGLLIAVLVFVYWWKLDRVDDVLIEKIAETEDWITNYINN